MAGGLPCCILVCLAIGLATVYSEVCHIQPQCTCARRNNSNIICDKMSTPYIPFLGMSHFRFYDLQIRGNPGVMYIHDGTFSGLNISNLDIQFTGISELNCSDFSGIGEKVSRIYLPNNLLNRVPSCALARFSSITKLDLRNNSIITVRPSDFEHFTRLQTLDLSANGMSRIELAAFGGLNELTTLDLSHNNISVLHDYMFHGLTELKTLDLDFNKLTSLDDNLFDDLTNLENLYLRNNRISGLSKRTFRNLRRLGYISLMRNKLTHLLPETFAGLTNLYGLSLHDNRLREIGPRMFVGLSKVTFIFLSLNKLTLINRDAFVDFPVLNYLNLTGNAIRNMQAGSFRNLSSLSTLDLSGNQLTDIGPDVFFNVSRLRALHLENNQISFLSEVLFYVIKNSLREVNLKSNELSSTSWKWLGKLLGHLKGLRMLDLSHNPLKYIPSDVIPTLATMLEVRLRNCSLDKVPDNAWNVSLDLSMNNIQGPLLLRNSHTASSRLNVSNNKITALNVKIPYRNNHYTDNLIVCDNNQIQDSLVIEVEHPTEFSDRSYIKVSAKHNFINEAIQFLFHEKQDGDVSLRLNADLSFNTYVNVTKLPVDIKVKPGGEVLIPGGRSAPVVFRNYEITLNLSNNAISYISPEACLGIVYKLDLRNNRLEVFGDLMPKTDSPEYKLQYLYLSGNRLHRVTTETFDRYELLYHLDLRDNDIISLNSFNISNRFPELFLTGNPLTCGCEIAGLRNGTMPDKIDLVRCHSPRAFTGYLAVCFPLSACSSSVSVSVSDKTRWLCEQDSNIKLSNLTVTVENGVVSVTWTKTGPGMMTGYRVKYHPVNDIGMGGSTLVHPETEKVLLDDLSKDTTYNICVFAVVRSRRKSPAVCTGIPVISARNETPFAEGGVVIGLASALGLCVLLAGAVTICLCVRKRRSGQNQPNDSSLDTEPGNSQSVSTNPAYVPTNVSAQAELGEINSVNIRHPNNGSQTEDGNIYERINRSTAHENSGFRA